MRLACMVANYNVVGSNLLRNIIKPGVMITSLAAICNCKIMRRIQQQRNFISKVLCVLESLILKESAFESQFY